MRLRQFLGLFWPIFDSLEGGNIRVYDPLRENQKSAQKNTKINRSSLCRHPLSVRFLLPLLSLTFLFAQEADELVWNPRIPKRGEQVTPPKEYTPQKKQKKKRLPRSHIQIGGSYTYAHITPSSLPSFHGHLGGIQVLYEYKRMNFFYGGVAFLWAQGNTQGVRGNRFLFKIDAQERLGYTWGWRKKKRFFSLFSGIGYRHYGHRLQSSGSTVRFNYNELYIPVGFLFQGRVNSITDLGLNFQWMPQVYPTLTINPLKGARWILNSKMTNFRGELPITLYLSRKHHVTLAINPFFEYWRDGQTNARTQLGTNLRVPGNTYLFPGIDINFGYAF